LVVAKLVGPAPNHNHGAEVRHRSLRLDDLRRDADAVNQRRLQRPRDPLLRQLSQHLDSRLLGRELRPQSLQASELGVFGRIRDALVKRAHEPADGGVIDGRRQRDGRARLGRHGGRDTLLDADPRAEACRDDTPRARREDELNGTSERGSQGRLRLLVRHAADRDAGHRHPFRDERRRRGVAAERGRQNRDDENQDP
jgi:hypothetical protein